VSASFVYDGLGRREKKTINGNLTEFLFDRLNPVQETSGAAVLSNILPGLGIDEFLTRTDVVAGLTSYFLADALGSAVAVTDATGVVQTDYTYEPFGRTTFAGVMTSSSYQYTGRENDGTGLYYYRARYYHPELQRFISEDPIGFAGSDWNLYGYVSNNPLLFTDPFGFDKCKAGTQECGPKPRPPCETMDCTPKPPPPTPPCPTMADCFGPGPQPPPQPGPTGPESGPAPEGGGGPETDEKPSPYDWLRLYDWAMGNACEAGIAFGCSLIYRNPPACAALGVGICNFRPQPSKGKR
jgi:RHS repeat-associated protein